MLTVNEVLLATGIRYVAYPKWRFGGVFLTAANQLVGAYSDLGKFQRSDQNYFGWQKHHIVESQDLERLGLLHVVAPRDQQICVLIPERAHVRRINSVLRSQNPVGVQVTGAQLRRAYRDAYALMGDYCGGGEAQVRRELVAIVDAIFRKLGVR